MPFRTFGSQYKILSLFCHNSKVCYSPARREQYTFYVQVIKIIQQLVVSMPFWNTEKKRLCQIHHYPLKCHSTWDILACLLQIKRYSPAPSNHKLFAFATDGVCIKNVENLVGTSLRFCSRGNIISARQKSLAVKELFFGHVEFLFLKQLVLG